MKAYTRASRVLLMKHKIHHRLDTIHTDTHIRTGFHLFSPLSFSIFLHFWVKVWSDISPPRTVPADTAQSYTPERGKSPKKMDCFSYGEGGRLRLLDGHVVLHGGSPDLLSFLHRLPIFTRRSHYIAPDWSRQRYIYTSRPISPLRFSPRLHCIFVSSFSSLLRHHQFTM